MTSYASIQDAWGPPSFSYEMTKRPTAYENDDRSGKKESFAGYEQGETSSYKRGAITRKDVRDYIRDIYATEGADGLCKLLGRRLCRDVRTRCMFDLEREDVILLFLVATIAYLSFKLAVSGK